MIIALGLVVAACGEVTGPGPGDPGGAPPDDPPAPSVVACEGGKARVWSCSGIDLISRVRVLDLEPGRQNLSGLNDVWGWTDPLDGSEYALVGRRDGLSIIDVTDPFEPRPVGYVASPTPASTWRDVKVYENHAFIVADGSPNHGIQIVDLTRLRDMASFGEITVDARYTGVSSVHNIAINEETGFAYAVGSNSGGNTCGGGLHMIDVRSPLSPSFAGCYAEAGTGRSGTGYTHDVQCVVYRGPDVTYGGREICLGSNENAIVIADVTDKSSPQVLSRGFYANTGYTHQGWLSEDHRFFYQNDEIDELNGSTDKTRLLVWDVQDLEDPVLVKEHFGPTGATDHNLYVHEDVLYHSNYSFGIRILDLADPGNPIEMGFFDTYLEDDEPSFSGSWSNYPYFESGTILVTSANEGLFLLRLQ
jgi:choice-of-anchor B domain-containing protein